MQNTEDMAVQGNTIITYLDSMYMTFRQTIVRVPIFVIIVSATAICIPIIFSFMHPDSLAAQEPVRETARFIVENWKLPIIAGVLYLLGMQICSAVCFMRLPVAARTVTYAINAAGMGFTNGQGSSGQMPWTTIRSATRTTRYIILRPKIGALRFIALRAFADSEKLWKLVAANVPSR